MPNDTFYNLDSIKRDKVYKALINEFTTNTLEDVSIKNIVTDAGIPRGSFYQYFTDKEDALRFLITETRELEHYSIQAENLYHLIIVLFDIETKTIKLNTESLRLRILKQISKSPRASAIFNEEISNGAMNSPIFRNYLKNSKINSLNPTEKRSVLELLIASLKDALFSVLLNSKQIEEIRNILVYKIQIIKNGIDRI